MRYFHESCIIIALKDLSLGGMCHMLHHLLLVLLITISLKEMQDILQKKPRLKHVSRPPWQMNLHTSQHNRVWQLLHMHKMTNFATNKHRTYLFVCCSLLTLMTSKIMSMLIRLRCICQFVWPCFCKPLACLMCPINMKNKLYQISSFNLINEVTIVELTRLLGFSGAFIYIFTHSFL